MSAQKHPTAGSISAFLRRAGWRPGQLNGREGVQVVNSIHGAHVRLLWDSERRCRREQAEMITALTDGGYKATASGSFGISVTR